MNFLGLSTIPGVWKKTTTWAIALLMAMWAAVVVVWKMTDADTQQRVLTRWGLEGQSSAELVFYFSAASAAINAALLFLRTTSFPWEPDTLPKPVAPVLEQ